MQILIVSFIAQAEEVFKESALLILQVDTSVIKVKQVAHKSIAFYRPKENKDLDNARFSLLSKDNEILYSQSFSDHFHAAEDGLSSHKPFHGMVRQKQSEFILKIPYIQSAKRIQFEREHLTTGAMTIVGVSHLDIPVK